MVTTNDAKLAEKLRILRIHGAKPKYHHALLGGNFRLDTVQAAIVLAKLDHIERWNQQRRQNAAKYSKLSEYLEIPDITPGHVFNQFVVRTKRRDALAAYLKENRIGSAIYYPSPLHLQEVFSNLGYQIGDFPEAEKACKEVLALPIFPELAATEIQEVVDCVAAFFKGRGK